MRATFEAGWEDAGLLTGESLDFDTVLSESKGDDGEAEAPSVDVDLIVAAEA